MNAPRLSTPLLLENPTRVADGMGGFRRDWRTLGTVWAEMKAGTGNQQEAEAGARGVVAWRIITRAAPPGDPRRPCPEQRFRLGDRVFRIAAVAETDPSGFYLTCFSKEETAT
ncbi:head-tail adaptor protein [Paracoccus pacificus]|uniref:Head-tail adaptor protein n=1 Tax=Paracoccus pacificus TaxID=1463598 RepID=A0ABW4R8Y4_9RHOB